MNYRDYFLNPSNKTKYQYTYVEESVETSQVEALSGSEPLGVDKVELFYSGIDEIKAHEPFEYELSEGGSLEDVAIKFGLGFTFLRKFNQNIYGEEKLFWGAGDIVYVPVLEVQVVNDSSTLENLAQKYEVSAKAIELITSEKRLTSTEPMPLLIPGDTVFVPIHQHYLQNGETVEDIAVQYNVTPVYLVNYNYKIYGHHDIIFDSETPIYIPPQSETAIEKEFNELSMRFHNDRQGFLGNWWNGIKGWFGFSQYKGESLKDSSSWTRWLSEYIFSSDLRPEFIENKRRQFVEDREITVQELNEMRYLVEAYETSQSGGPYMVSGTLVSTLVTVGVWGLAAAGVIASATAIPVLIASLLIGALGVVALHEADASYSGRQLTYADRIYAGGNGLIAVGVPGAGGFLTKHLVSKGFGGLKAWLTSWLSQKAAGYVGNTGWTTGYTETADENSDIYRIWLDILSSSINGLGFGAGKKE